MSFSIRRTPRHTHSDRLDRWLGPGQAEVYSAMFRDWYGPPVSIAGVPGGVYVTKGGDFVGPIRGGGFANLLDFAYQRQRRIFRNWADRQSRTTNAGFSSLSDLISEVTQNGKGQFLIYSKSLGATSVAGSAFSTWLASGQPGSGSGGGTSGTGRVTTRTTVGALRQANPVTGGDTQHLTTWTAQATNVNSAMLVDRLWDMAYNHATATTTAIDAANRPTRYQTTALAGGSFISGEVSTALSATAHNLTITYVDDAGNAAEAGAAYAAPVSAGVGRAPLVAGNWFMPLNAPDLGVRYLTNIAQSTITSVTGFTNFWIGHPIALIPFPVANMPFVLDGINSAFNLQRIFDDACLFLYTPAMLSTGAHTYSGVIQTAAG